MLLKVSEVSGSNCTHTSNTEGLPRENSRVATAPPLTSCGPASPTVNLISPSGLSHPTPVSHCRQHIPQIPCSASKARLSLQPHPQPSSLSYQTPAALAQSGSCRVPSDIWSSASAASSSWEPSPSPHLPELLLSFCPSLNVTSP